MSSLTARLKKASTPKDEKKSNRIVIEEPNPILTKLCVKLAKADASFKKAKMDKDLAAAEIKESANKLRIDAIKSGQRGTSLDLHYDDDRKAQVTFKQQFSAITLANGVKIEGTIGETNYARFFESKRSIAIQSNIAQNDDKLEALIGAMDKAGLPFEDYFNVVEIVAPRESFDQERYEELSDKDNDMLNKLGVKQTVSVMIR